MRKIHHHHHHVALLERIFLTHSRRPSLSSIAPGRSSRPHPVSSQSGCMYVRARRPAFARPCEVVHRSTSLMSSYLLLQQCSACLVRLTLIVFVTDGCTVAVLWGAVSRACSILLAAFLCNFRQASSPYVLLASTWCIHIAVSILPRLGRNCSSFYRSGLTVKKIRTFLQTIGVSCLQFTYTCERTTFQRLHLNFDIFHHKFFHIPVNLKTQVFNLKKKRRKSKFIKRVFTPKFKIMNMHMFFYNKYLLKMRNAWP